jgi:hypothetical protein
MTQKWSQSLSPLLLSNSPLLHSNRDIHNSQLTSPLIQNVGFHPPFHSLPLSCNCTYLSVNNDGILTGIEITVGQHPNNTTATSLSNNDTRLALSIKVEKYYYSGESFSLIFSAALRQRFVLHSFSSSHFDLLYSSFHSFVL